MHVIIGTDDGIHDLGGPRALAGHTITAVLPGPPPCPAIVDGELLVRFDPARGAQEVAKLAGAAATCLLDRGEEILVGTEQGHLLRVAAGAPQPVDAFERAPGRERWYTPWGAPPDVRSLAEVDGAVLVNVHVGGIVRSVDLEVWETTVDIDYDVHQVIPVPGRPGWALGAAAVGLLVSTDGGRSWAVETAGLHATYCRAAAATDAWVVVSASAGHRGDRAALYRRPLDGSAPLERCRDGLAEWFASNIDTGCLVAAGSTVAAGTAEGQVFQSDDDGLTWATVASGLPRVRALALL